MNAVSEVMYGERRIRLGAVIAVALAAAFLVWFFAIRDTGGESPAKAGGGPVSASQADIAALGAQLGHPVYWAGDQSGAKLELTRTTDDRAYVRYLDKGVPIGDPKPAYLTVGTYPFKGALKALKAVANRPGASVEHIDQGGLVVTNDNAPTSVYIAYPGQDLQIEVYDPDPARAMSLATSGAIQPAD